MLNIDIEETIKNIECINNVVNNIKKNYSRVYGDYEALGRSWNDREYVKIKKNLEDAGVVINRFQKDIDAYLGLVRANIQKLAQDYLSDGGSLGQLQIDGLNDLGIDIDKGLNDTNKVLGALDEFDRKIENKIDRFDEKLDGKFDEIEKKADELFSLTVKLIE